MKHWVKFRKDRFYLVKYLTFHMLLGLAVVALQLHFMSSPISFDITPEWWHLMVFPLGLIFAVIAPVTIHNCVHGNFKQKYLNNVIGEITGVYVLLSMAAFELNHVMHHAHSDSELDPHNPHNRNFFGFFLANNFGGAHVVEHKFLQYHGDTKENRMLFKLIMVLHFLNVPIRLAFWFLALGASAFFLVFVPSYLFHMFVFSHINYVTHETKENGEVVLYNLDHNLYYKFVNFFGSGVYYHKNHHLQPNFYNPQKGRSSSLLVR
jgi:fatty acid desaturase